MYLDAFNKYIKSALFEEKKNNLPENNESQDFSLEFTLIL